MRRRVLTLTTPAALCSYAYEPGISGRDRIYTVVEGGRGGQVSRFLCESRYLGTK